MIDPQIEKYCKEHSSPIHSVLQELERETHLKTLAPQMISGPLQGSLLQMICTMIRPNRVLEIGTFTGYSAISMALGCPDSTIIDTIEANLEFEPIIRNYIEKVGVQDKIQLHIGDALQVLSTFNELYDLVFIDAAKRDYPKYFDCVIGLIRQGGYILSDNVLWDGKVLKGVDDLDTQAIIKYNVMLKNDPRVEVLLLPIRDGISIARVVS